MNFFATIFLSDSLSSSVLFSFGDYSSYLLPTLSFRDEEGISSCVTYPCYHAVATTPPAVSFPFQSFFGETYCLRYTVSSSACWFLSLSRLPVHSLALRPGNLRNLLYRSLVNELHGFHFFHPCHLATEFLTFSLMGFAPTGYVHLSWTHNRA